MKTPRTLNPWQQHAAPIAAIVAISSLVLFGVGYFFEARIDATLRIGTLPAVLAGVTLLVVSLSFVRLPERVATWLPLFTQLLLVATVMMTIYTTGGMSSLFLALWMPAVILIGAFNIRAPLFMALIPIGYGAWLALQQSLSLEEGALLFFIGLMPLSVSYLFFSRMSGSGEDSSYRQLANQFSQVSGKSDAVINAITNGVIALDQQGIIELINPAAQHLIGWESSDALKLDYKSVLKLVDADSKELAAAADPVKKALSNNEEVRTEELSLITNSGKKLLISLVASPVGQLGAGVIVVFRDITKEKAEEREQAEFISTASHEMRTPVASIEGYLGLALNPATAQIDDKARTYITKAHEVAQHLGRLFQDLLDITKAEDGRLSNNPRVVEVVSFVQDIVEGLRPQAEAKGLILVYKPIPDDDEDSKAGRRLNPVFYANVDNDHFREIVSNLVENAIKYTKQGTVSVDVGGDDKQVEVSVQDTGIGIPAEDLPHLFQKFYRVDNSDTREIGGTGLGLYLSRRLVEAMEGRVWAESQHGQGSTFYMAVPRISHEEAMQLIETLRDEEHTAPATAPVTPQPVEPMTVPPTPPVTTPQPAPAQVSPPMPQQSAAPVATEGVFMTPPADVIAAQLTATPTTTPQVPAPAVAPSLATIEQNPAQYLQQPAPPVPPVAPAQEAPQVSQVPIPPQNQNQP